MADEKKASDEALKNEGKEAEKKEPSEAEKLNKELLEKTKLADEYLNRMKYLQAEFDNFRKREESDRKEFVRFANHELIAALLNIVDDFERAIAATKDAKEKAALEMILKRFAKVLSERGVKPIEAVGKRFDAHLHEAFLSEESGKEEGTVLEELQKGYMLHDKVLRHTKVKVAKKGEDAKK